MVQILPILQLKYGNTTNPAVRALFPHSPNSIKDPEYSIECGVQAIAAALKEAKCKNPMDMDRIRLALQGYNYGNGYLLGHKT